MKRSLSMFLALGCSLSLATCAHAADGLQNFTRQDTYAHQFSDVQDQWFSSAVAGAYEFGLMKGSNGLFLPDKQVSIAEALTMACRIHNIYQGGDGVFQQGKVWYQVYVDYAKANGLLKFTPTDYKAAATRGEFASILSAALPDEALEPRNQIADGAIPDVAMSHPYAADIYRLYRAGILTGSNGGAYLPEKGIKRSESAAINTRMVDPAQRKDVVLTPQARPTRSQLEALYDSAIPTYINPTGRLLADVTHDGIPELILTGPYTLGFGGAYSYEVMTWDNGQLRKLPCEYSYVDSTTGGAGTLRLHEIDGKQYLGFSQLAQVTAGVIISRYIINSLDQSGQLVPYSVLDRRSDSWDEMQAEYDQASARFNPNSIVLATTDSSRPHAYAGNALDWDRWFPQEPEPEKPAVPSYTSSVADGTYTAFLSGQYEEVPGGLMTSATLKEKVPFAKAELDAAVAAGSMDLSAYGLGTVPLAWDAAYEMYYGENTDTCVGVELTLQKDGSWALWSSYDSQWIMRDLAQAELFIPTGCIVHDWTNSEEVLRTDIRQANHPKFGCQIVVTGGAVSDITIFYHP